MTQKAKITSTAPQAPSPSSAPRPTGQFFDERNHFSGLIVVERLVYIVFGVLQVILAFRFVLSLLAANKDNIFADSIFGASGPFVAPFLNLFNYQTAYGASRLELETLVAMAVYALLSALIGALCRLPRRTHGV